MAEAPKFAQVVSWATLDGHVLQAPMAHSYTWALELIVKASGWREGRLLEVGGLGLGWDGHQGELAQEGSAASCWPPPLRAGGARGAAAAAARRASEMMGAHRRQPAG